MEVDIPELIIIRYLEFVIDTTTDTKIYQEAKAKLNMLFRDLKKEVLTEYV